jgi:hypothetical protein
MKSAQRTSDSDDFLSDHESFGTALEFASDWTCGVDHSNQIGTTTAKSSKNSSNTSPSTAKIVHYPQ